MPAELRQRKRRPAFLADVAKRESKRISKMLVSIGMITELDGPARTTYCQA